jgi:TPR repeat protein
MRIRCVAIAAEKSAIRSAIFALALQACLTGHAMAGPDETEQAASAAYARADYSTALALIRPLAEAGNSRAQVDLGGLYFEGYGVAKNTVEACRWFRKAADQDFVPGQFFLALCLRESAGMSHDSAEVREWLRKAADQGYAPAEVALGAPFSPLSGSTATPDQVEGPRWFQKAVADGYPPALVMLGMTHAIHFWPQEQEEAIRLFRLAAEKGDVTAEEQLGRIYSQGMGLQPDYAEAFKWDLKAAEHGDTRSQTQLAWSYAQGRGVPKDSVQARMWYDISRRNVPTTVGALDKAMVQLKKTVEELFDTATGPMTDAQKAQAKSMADVWIANHPGAPHRPTERPSMWVSPGALAAMPDSEMRTRTRDAGHAQSAPPMSSPQPDAAATTPADSLHPCTHDEANQKRIAIQNGYTTIPNCQ